MNGLSRSASSLETMRPAGRCSAGSDALVAIARDEVVDGERDAHHRPAALRAARGRDDKRQRPHQVRDDAGQRAALADEQPHLLEVERLQRAQAAVQGLQVVERGAAAEVAAIDQGHGEAAVDGVPGDGRAVDSGADDQHVEPGVRQSPEVAHHQSPASLVATMQACED